MDIGEVKKKLLQGEKMARKGWNGKGMFIYYVPAAKYKSCTKIGTEISDKNGTVSYEPYMAMKNVKGTVNTWVPSVADFFANDWQVAK